MAERLPGLTVLWAGNPGPLTGTGNHTYLLRGATPTLVDAGVGDPGHLDAIAAALDADGVSLAQVLVTHGHSDHIAGVTSLAARWPAAQFYKFPWQDTDNRYPVNWRPLADGDVLPAGNMTLQVVHTPGHAPDHVCFWHAGTRSMFGGDLLIEGGTVVVPGTRGGNLLAYLSSLSRVANLAPEIILPAHGPVIREPLSLIERYSAHRAERERQVLAAVADGATSIDAVARRVYPDLPEATRPVAIETVHAHVNKLRDEGRLVSRHGQLQLV